MYKEILDILMEDINDHNNIKEQILKNQLEYHFTNKNKENKNTIDSTAVITRRVLNRFTLGDIIGIQPITDKENPTVLSGGLKYDIDVCTRPLQAGLPDITEKDLETMRGIDLDAETNQACGYEIETEIVSEFLDIISQYAPETKISIEDWTAANILGVATTIRSVIKEVNANWVVISPTILAILQSDKDSNYSQDGEKAGTMDDLMFVGRFDENVKVYCSLWHGDTVLIGSKNPDSEDTPIVYAPETMVLSGHRRQHPDTKNWHTELMTRYGKYVNLHEINDQYRKISLDFQE